MTRVLIVDDDAPTRSLLRRALMKQGHEVFEASDGQEGWALALQVQPMVIVSDWMMPNLDGLELCRQVKSHPDLANVFFILLTTKGNRDDRIVGLDTGADDFLAKPIDVEELRARVRAGLRNYQITQTLKEKNQALQVLTEDLQNQKQLLEREFQEAAAYVRSLLPKPMQGDVQIDARFIPSQQLGGDCFDYYWLDPDFLAIYLLDVAGHGLGAALLSVTVLNVLRTQTLPGVNFYQPSHVLEGLNETFQMSDQFDKYFTIWYGVYNRARRQLVYSSAGHPPALLVTPDPHGSTVVKLLKRPGVPIGMVPNMQFTNDRCDIDPNSLLYIYSDGIYEIKQADGQYWGFKPFVEYLSNLENVADVEQILQHVHELNVSDSLEDDLSLLQLRFPMQK